VIKHQVKCISLIFTEEGTKPRRVTTPKEPVTEPTPVRVVFS